MGFDGMMYGWGGGGGGWIMYFGMIAFWAGLLGLLAWGFVSLVRGDRTGDRSLAQASPNGPDLAIDVLKRRYAAGEIDRAEYEVKRRDLS